MRKFLIGIIILFVVFYSRAGAENRTANGSITRNISAEGSCAVVEMTAEQCQLLALQRARAAAIEQAAGVAVSSSTLVTNGMLAVDFIKTYAKGYVINEKVEWLPLGQYQKDKSTAPIPEYRVKITADVYAPAKKIKPLWLKVKLNGVTFRDGERARLEITVGRKARVGVFNITADDRVTMLFPNDYERDNTVSRGEPLEFPAQKSKVELTMHTLAGHKRDAEAFFVIAVDDSHPVDFTGMFEPLTPMGISAFFKKYSEIADYAEDAIITYEVVREK